MQEVYGHILDKLEITAFIFFSLLASCHFFLIFQIGHVTKSGDIAGPRLLEHIVDVVLYMEVGELLFQILEENMNIS